MRGRGRGRFEPYISAAPSLGMQEFLENFDLMSLTHLTMPTGRARYATLYSEPIGAKGLKTLHRVNSFSCVRAYIDP